MQISHAIEAFLLSYRGSKSPATITWYGRRLNDLRRFLGDVEIERITITDLRRFRASLDERGLSVRTRHGYVRSIKRFFVWLVEENCLAVNIAQRLELPRLPKGEVKGIRQEDLKKMLEAAKSSARDYAVCWCFYSTAARLGGIVGMRLRDIDLEHCRIVVCEKFTKSRPVFLLPEAVIALRAWLEVRPDTDDDHVFIGKRGALTGSGIYQVLRSVAERAGLNEGGWNPHNWRHRRARDLLAANVPLSVVSQLLGHSGVQVTADIYGLLDTDQLQRASNGVGMQ